MVEDETAAHYDPSADSVVASIMQTGNRGADDGSVHTLSICVAGTSLSLRKCPAIVRNGEAKAGPNRMGDAPHGLAAALRRARRK